MYRHISCSSVFRYLKTVVLPVLTGNNEITKVHATRPLTAEELAEQKTQLKGVTRAPRTVKDLWMFKRKIMPAPPKPVVVPEVFGKDVGVGEDWSHLNKRRQRAREATVAREVQWARMVEKARRATQSQAS